MESIPVIYSLCDPLIFSYQLLELYFKQTGVKYDYSRNDPVIAKIIEDTNTNIKVRWIPKDCEYYYRIDKNEIGESIEIEWDLYF